MTDFRRKDKVRVTYEAEYLRESINHDVTDHIVGASGDYYNVPYVATIELIERADDPSTDPIGTVRQHTRETAISEGPYWRRFDRGGMVQRHCSVVDWPIIGAVPGTPAWDAWIKGELKGCTTGVTSWPDPVERPLWTGDGSEEPPEYVTKVRDRDGATLTRAHYGWRGVGDGFEEYDTVTLPWDGHASGGLAPYTEVRG